MGHLHERRLAGGELAPGHHGDGGDGHGHVDECGEDHRADEAEGDIAFRVLHLFADVEDVLKADEGIEGEDGSLHHQRQGDA